MPFCRPMIECQHALESGHATPFYRVAGDKTARRVAICRCRCGRDSTNASGRGRAASMLWRSAFHGCARGRHSTTKRRVTASLLRARQTRRRAPRRIQMMVEMRERSPLPAIFPTSAVQPCSKVSLLKGSITSCNSTSVSTWPPRTHVPVASWRSLSSGKMRHSVVVAVRRVAT